MWHIVRGYITHVFKGHGGVVSALAFHSPFDASSVTTAQEEQTIRLITASVDTRIRIFNLTAGASTSSGGGKAEAVLEGHVSVPRGLAVSADGRWLVSGGRDSVVLIWDLLSKPSPNSAKMRKNTKNAASLTPTLVKTVPALERVEAVGILHSDDVAITGANSELSQLHFYTGGEKGIVKLWNGKGEITKNFGQEYSTSSEELEEQRQITNIL